MQFELLQNNLTTPFPDSNYTSERSLNRPRREGSVPMRVQDRRCWVINFMIEWKCKVLNLFQVESIRTSPNRPKVSFEILIKILFVIIILNSFRIHRLRKSRLTHSSSDPNLTKKKKFQRAFTSLTYHQILQHRERACGCTTKYFRFAIATWWSISIEDNSITVQWIWPHTLDTQKGCELHQEEFGAESPNRTKRSHQHGQRLSSSEQVSSATVEPTRNQNPKTFPHPALFRWN